MLTFIIFQKKMKIRSLWLGKSTECYELEEDNFSLDSNFNKIMKKKLNFVL